MTSRLGDGHSHADHTAQRMHCRAEESVQRIHRRMHRRIEDVVQRIYRRMTSRVGGGHSHADHSVQRMHRRAEEAAQRIHRRAEEAVQRIHRRMHRRAVRDAQRALETGASAAASSSRKRKGSGGSRTRQGDHKRYALESQRREQLRIAAEERRRSTAPALTQQLLTRRRRAQLITRINEDGIDLDSLNLSKEDIFAIAPSLTHVSLHGLFDASWSQVEQERLIRLCTAAISIHINSSSIRALPSTLVCRDLFIRGCENLREIPTLGHLRRLTVDNCSRLRKVCAQPNLTIGQFLQCKVLAEIGKLPLCETAKLQHLSELVTLPEALPECKEFECVANPLLPFLPELAECRLLRCDDCATLATLGTFLPALEALSCRNCPALTRRGVSVGFNRLKVFSHSGTPALADKPERLPQALNMVREFQMMLVSALLGGGLFVPGSSPHPR